MDNQTISTELSQYIRSHTWDQIKTSLNFVLYNIIKTSLWLNLHNGQITSFQIGTICHRRSTTDNTNIIRMGYQKMVGMPRQIRWGVEKESEARQCYIHCDDEGAVQSGGVCSTIRLNTLAPEHCYLGATSDGIIMHAQRPSAGVLEIKCTVSVSDESVSELSPIEIAKYHPNFYLESKDGACF